MAVAPAAIAARVLCSAPGRPSMKSPKCAAAGEALVIRAKSSGPSSTMPVPRVALARRSGG